MYIFLIPKYCFYFYFNKILETSGRFYRRVQKKSMEERQSASGRVHVQLVWVRERERGWTPRFHFRFRLRSVPFRSHTFITSPRFPQSALHFTISPDIFQSCFPPVTESYEKPPFIISDNQEIKECDPFHLKKYMKQQKNQKKVKKAETLYIKLTILIHPTHLDHTHYSPTMFFNFPNSRSL